MHKTIFFTKNSLVAILFCLKINFVEIVFMSKDLENYNKELKMLNFNKFDFSKHKIDKNQVAKSYQDYAKIVNDLTEKTDADLDDLIRYENWLLGE